MAKSVNSIGVVKGNNNLACPKLKVFADDKINATQTLKFVTGRVENIVGKTENAGYQHVILFSSLEHGVLSELL